MQKHGWAALAAAGMLAFAGQAGATIVDVAISAEFFSLQGPAGFYPTGASCNTNYQFYYCTSTGGGREFVNFGAGGIPYSANFAFDTDLGGVLTTTTDRQTLTWDSTMGATSPLLSGRFQFGQQNLPLLIDLDLTTATSFLIERNPFGLYFTFSSPDFTFSQSPSGVSLLAGARLDTPGSSNCLCGGIYYSDAAYTTYNSELFFESVTPRAPVPEPSSWAMLILGFTAIGAALRRRRRRALSPA